jgi:hypothetical protein
VVSGDGGVLPVCVPQTTTTTTTTLFYCHFSVVDSGSVWGIGPEGGLP